MSCQKIFQPYFLFISDLLFDVIFDSVKFDKAVEIVNEILIFKLKGHFRKPISVLWDGKEHSYGNNRNGFFFFRFAKFANKDIMR